jgi:predicted nucleotidyltransferase
MDIKHILNTLRDTLNKYDTFMGLYLYGSRVNGNFREDSDLDVIILFKKETSYSTDKEIAGIVGKIEYENNVFIDYHPMTYQQLQNNPVFFDEVVNKGVFYAAA